MGLWSQVQSVWLRAWRALVKNGLLVLLVALLDVGFFFALGFATSPVVDRIVAQSVALTTAMSQLLQSGQVYGLVEMLWLPLLRPMTLAIVGWMAVTLLIVYVVYVVFEGAAWYLCGEMVRRQDVRRFTRRFAVVNVLWFALFALFFVSLTLVDLRYTIVAGIVEAAKPVLPFVPLYLFLTALVVFAFVSYVTGSVKGAFHRVRDPVVLVSFVLLAVLFTVFQGLVYGIGLLSVSGAMVASLVGLPLISFARLVVFGSVKSDAD